MHEGLVVFDLFLCIGYSSLILAYCSWLAQLRGLNTIFIHETDEREIRCSQQCQPCLEPCNSSTMKTSNICVMVNHSRKSWICREDTALINSSLWRMSQEQETIINNNGWVKPTINRRAELCQWTISASLWRRNLSGWFLQWQPLSKLQQYEINAPC